MGRALQQKNGLSLSPLPHILGWAGGVTASVLVACEPRKGDELLPVVTPAGGVGGGWLRCAQV